MKISTLSIVCGTEACNAKCPFCVSKMTPTAELPKKFDLSGVKRNLNKTIQFALQSGVSTVLITGKGEPTLFPEHVSQYIFQINNRFPFIELQTNGITLENDDETIGEYLKEWYFHGLTTVSISIVSPDAQKNKEIAGLSNRLVDVIKRIHDHRLAVRINCTMLKGGVDKISDVMNLIEWCKNFKVEQLTIRPVAAPAKPEDPEVARWVEEHIVPVENLEEIYSALRRRGTSLMDLPHNAEIFDVHGQNVCLNNCLTLPRGEEIRQLIFFPDGHLRYDWAYPGAILI